MSSDTERIAELKERLRILKAVDRGEVPEFLVWYFIGALVLATLWGVLVEGKEWPFDFMHLVFLAVVALLGWDKRRKRLRAAEGAYFAEEALKQIRKRLS